MGCPRRGLLAAREDAMARRALLVGLNHDPDPANNLRGCVNDVLQVSSLLQRGFLLCVADIACSPTNAPRRRGSSSASGGSSAAPDRATLVFRSGHGARVRDRHGDGSTTG
jgi:hypothetical protein